MVLVVIGVALDWLGILPPTSLSPNIFLGFLLPPLLFEAAFSIRWKHLASVGWATGVFATLGVVVSASITAALMLLVLHVPARLALPFGVLMAATDPVAVVSFFRRASVPPDLRALVEGESLLNDGMAVILIDVLAAMFVLGQVNPTVLVSDFIGVALGGLVVGGVVGFLGSLLARTTTDYLVETTLSLVVAFGSYAAAQDLGVSGVLAVVAAGSVLGNFGRQFGMSTRAREAIDNLWELLAFVANSLVFLLLGVAVAPGAFRDMIVLVGIGVVAALLGRAVVSYGLGAALARMTGIPPLSWRHVLFWGGLRGALPVVIAISVSSEYGASDVLTRLVLGVVVVSLLIQGLTLEPVLRRVLRLAD